MLPSVASSLGCAWLRGQGGQPLRAVACWSVGAARGVSDGGWARGGKGERGGGGLAKKLAEPSHVVTRVTEKEK